MAVMVQKKIQSPIPKQVFRNKFQVRSQKLEGTIKDTLGTMIDYQRFQSKMTIDVVIFCSLSILSVYEQKMLAQAIVSKLLTI